MFLVRFAVLALFVAYAHTRAGPLNAFGETLAIVGLISTPILYVLPSIEAWMRRHPSLQSIMVLNLLLGWTVVGWVVSAAWALLPAKPAAEPVPEPAKEPERRACPECAELVLAAARRCKHCGAELTPLQDAAAP